MLGNFSGFCCRLLTFFKIIFFEKISFRNIIRVSNGFDLDQVILVQTVCKGYQQMTKVATIAREELKNDFIPLR